MEKLKDYKYIHTQPKISPEAFIASGVKLIGAVVVGDYSSIWYNTVIRADINKIEIGLHTNIQDLCVLHVDDDLGVKIGDWVTVGHGAILHACAVEDGALVGSGANVLNAARIGKEHPAKIARKLTKEEIKESLYWANKYEKLFQKYRKLYSI